MNADNDNNDPFQPIAAAAARVLARAERAADFETDEKKSETDADGERRRERNAEGDREYIEHRLHDLRAFEDRARGIIRRRRRGPASIWLGKRR
jgi:hypothetical protein